jgi:uncharacterized phage protein gp47/JayE
LSSPYVTANGLQIPTIGDAATPGTILGDLAARQRAVLDPNLDCEADAPMGEINGIYAERERSVWEALQVAWDGFDPDAAEDFLLDALSAVTGTVRGAATASTVILSLNLNAHTTVTAGALVSVVGEPGIVFATDADIVNSTAGVLNVTGPATCTVVGRTIANATMLTVIQTPTVGWNSVTNPADAIPGQERDTDPELRVRRVNELEASGAGTVDTIQAKVAAITNPDDSKPVLDCKTYENTSDYISPEGIPAHAVEAVIYDGPGEDAPDNSVAQAVWDTKGAGITAFGNQSGIATDKEGNPQNVAFSRAAVINGKIAITVETDVARPDDYAGDIALKAALVAQLDAKAVLGVTEIRATHYVAAAQGAGLGVLDVTNLQLGNVLSSLLGNLVNFPVPFRTKFLLDTSNITVTRVAVTP